MRILTLLSLLSLPAQAQKIDQAQFPWSKPLKQSQVDQIFICGNANIQPTPKSLRANFLLGPNHTGYLFKGMLPMKDYFDILEKENLATAKPHLQARFQEAHLWKVTQTGEAKDLGAPKKIDLPMIATVKDCMEGAKTNLGNDCSAQPANIKPICCQEKFAGPVLNWAEGEAEYRLWYSPDPSIRLRVPGEKKHRFCNVQQEMAL